MGVQTSVALDPSVAIEGMVSRYSDVDALDRVAEAGINNGLLVVQGANERTCKAPAAAADIAKAIGITPYRATQMPGWPPGGTTTHYQAGDTIGAIRKGRVWVKVEEAVAAQDPVFVRHAANGGNTILGSFRKSADNPGGGATATQLAGSVYLTAAAGGGLALVEVNLP